MLRAFGTAMVVLLVLHLVAAGLFVGWLRTSGRLNQERVDRVVEMFKLTIAEEAEEDAKAEALAEEAETIARENARLEAVAQGPKTLLERFADEREADEIARHRVDRLMRETADLRDQIARAKDQIAKQKAELDVERQRFEQAVADRAEKLADDDFKQTVAMYEQIKPKQAKQMMQTLLAQGKSDDVVDYLAAMQLRKAANVLKEFKGEEDVVQATMILEQLRQRGVDALGINAGASAEPSRDKTGV